MENNYYFDNLILLKGARVKQRVVVWVIARFNNNERVGTRKVDKVIKEINQFFQSLNFKRVVIDDNANFEYKGEYYMVTKDGNSYYLECALNIHEAKKRWHEDIQGYSAKLYSKEDLIEKIKNDILKYTVNAEEE